MLRWQAIEGGVLLQQLGYSSSRSWQLQNWRHSRKPVHSCHLFLHRSEQRHMGGAGSWPGGEQTLTITIASYATKYFTIHCSIMDMPTISVRRRCWVYAVNTKWLMQCTNPVCVLMTFLIFASINGLFYFRVFKSGHTEWYSLTKNS
jgi:hypothetical protein